MAPASLESLQECLALQAKEIESIRRDHGLLRGSLEALRAESQALRRCLGRRGILSEQELGDGEAATAAAASAAPQRGEASTDLASRSTAAASGASVPAETTGKGDVGSPAPQPLDDGELAACKGDKQGAHSPRSESGSVARSRASSEPCGSRDASGRWDLYKAALPLLQAGSSTRVRTRALKTVEFQLSRGASPSAWQGPGTPLQGAVRGRCTDLVAALLHAKGSANESEARSVSLLHLAAYNGQSELCRLLLEARAGPNAADCHGQTPLFFAPSRQVCDMLYRSHADMNCTNLKGQSALHLAARGGLGDVLVWLSSRISRAVLGLRDVDGAAAADYARNAGVRLEVLEKLEVVAAGGHGGSGPRTASPRRLGAPPPPPGVDLSWELPAGAVPGAGAPEACGRLRGGTFDSPGASPLDASAPLTPAHLPGSPGREPAGDFCFRSVAGGGPGHLDQRRSVRGELQERQARNAAKQDAALARRMTARDL